MNANLYLLIQKPFYQALAFSLFTAVVILIARPKSADTAWTIAAYIFTLFLVVNAVMLWFVDSPWRYFFSSIASALGYLLFIAIIMQGVLKIFKLESSGESAMAFLILIYQPFALLLMILAKWIVGKWF